jgi:lipopolysaccharide export LptBFGC system permease protein LptF
MMGGKLGWDEMVVVGLGVAKMREIATEGNLPHKLRLHRGFLSFNEELITANVQALPYLSDLDPILEEKKNNHETYLPNVHMCIYQPISVLSFPSSAPSFSNPRVRCKSQPTGFIIGPTFHHFQLSYFPPLTNGLANPDSWLRREEGP